MSMIKFFKIRYIPTQLYFKPNNEVWHKNNLSKNGKTYNTKPTLKYIDNNHDFPKDKSTKIWYKGEQIEVRKEDFEIVEFEVIEVNVYKS